MSEYQTSMEEWLCAILTALEDLFESEGFSKAKKKRLKDKFAKVAGETAGKIAMKKIELSIAKELIKRSNETTNS